MNKRHGQPQTAIEADPPLGARGHRGLVHPVGERVDPRVVGVEGPLPVRADRLDDDALVGEPRGESALDDVRAVVPDDEVHPERLADPVRRLCRDELRDDVAGERAERHVEEHARGYPGLVRTAGPGLTLRAPYSRGGAPAGVTLWIAISTSASSRLRSSVFQSRAAIS